MDHFDDSDAMKLFDKYKDEIWVMTEKIHGSNFSFIYNGIVLQCARRNDILKPGENFHNY
jgi:hypothetical protein